MNAIEEYREECKRLFKILIDFEIQVTKLRIIQHEIKGEIYEIFERLNHIEYEEEEKPRLRSGKKWKEFKS